MRHPEWRDKKVKKWVKTYHTGVSIDFVALRDIQEGEEILIDYGEAWERAWQQHVQSFVPREGYMPAYEMNKLEHIEYRMRNLCMQRRFLWDMVRILSSLTLQKRILQHMKYSSQSFHLVDIFPGYMINSYLNQR